MISLITVAATTVINFFVYILKAVFSMLLWFVNLFFKALKFLFCALPVTTVFFSLLIIVNIVVLIYGSPEILNKIPDISGFKPVSPDQNTTLVIADGLKTWWKDNIYSYHGSGAYIPLFFLTIIMFIPVVSVFLCISALSSYKVLIFCLIAIDLIIYILRALGQKSFLAQFLGRYYFIFPESGKKHYEKSYAKWLRKHHEEFENDSFDETPLRDKYDDFYDEPDDEGYDSDIYEDSEFDDNVYEDEEYDDPEDDEYYEDEEYDDPEDDEYYEDDNSYDDGYDDDFDDEPSGPSTTFNFFAGCNSRESVEKKYRSLAKLYHPDNMDGDTASLQEINAQYEEAKKMFPR